MPADRRHITIKKFRLGSAEETAADLAYWQAVDPADRIEAAWNLTLELWRFKQWPICEPGLYRSVARVVRR